MASFQGLSSQIGSSPIDPSIYSSAPRINPQQQQQPASSTLSSLLAKANSLNTADVDPELPQIRFGIEEIERMSEIVARKGKRGKASQVDGHTLLSNLGINTSQLSHTISQLPTSTHADNSSTTTATPRQPRRRRLGGSRLVPVGDMGPTYPIGDNDVSGWGRNWHEMVILSGIEVQRQKTVKAFEAQFQQRILQNWENEKAKILQDELGATDDEISKLANGSKSNLGESTSSTLGRSRLGLSTRRFPMAQSIIGSKSSNVEAREGGLVMHNKAMKYERVISELNQKRLRREPYEICQSLEDTVKGDQKFPLLPTAYRILAHLTQEPSVRDSTDSNLSSSAEPVQERQYARAYLESSNGRGGAHAALLKGRLVTGARRFLERDFENHMDETIAKSPKEAALGGIPGIKNKVRAYVDVTLRAKETLDANKPEMVEGIYLWAQVYYLLRSGYPSDALSLIEEHQHSVKREDYTFPGSFKSFLTSPDHRLSRPQRDQLASDFNAHIRTSQTVDQYKLALYKIVGRFELSRKTVKVATTTEDWMWLQLTLTREQKELDPPQEQYDLRDLANLVLKYGNEKFDSNGTRPFAWFNLLLLTGQFERAVAYLYSKSQLKTDAVHFAIALQYYGLLRVPQSIDADLLSEDPEASLNFARIIQQYIAPFHKVEPQVALQYAYLVALGSDLPAPVGELQRQLALDLVRDIVIASRSWSKLLGSVRADGSKEIGVIERDLKLLQLNDEEDYLRSVVLAAADQSASDASLTDSVELYHLAGAYDRVVESINRALGHSLGHQSQSRLYSSTPTLLSVTGISGAFGGATDLEGLATRVYDLYAKDFGKRTKVPQKAWETLEILLKLKLALSQFYADRPDLALETLRSTSLLPLDNDASQISSYAQRFKTILDQPVVSSLDEIIVVAMKCLHRLSRSLRDSPYGDHARQAQLAGYKHQAQCLIQFASVLRLRLGPDVYRQLSSMSAFF